MSLTKDPQDWTVDEVVTFLCHEKPGDWSCNLASPDLVALETSLRENYISGSSFLEITDYYVKELGVKAIAQRQYVLKASQWLQRRSTKFQNFQLEQQQPPPKALLEEQQISPERVDDPISTTPLLDVPISTTASSDVPINPAVSLDVPINPSPLPDGSPPAKTGGKRPRRMETTIAERPPTSSLQEIRSPHELPDPNSAVGQEYFFDYLAKAYPPNDADVLPAFGESSSEGEYDTDIHEEIEEDESQSRPATPLDDSGNLEDAEFNEIVDEYINARKAHFDERRLPKELPKGFQIWTRGQQLPSMKSRISTRLAHLEKRCQALRKALAEAQHSSRSSLLQACACLDATIVDILLDKWKLYVLEQPTPPPKVPPLPRTPRAAKPDVNSDGEETLNSDSDSMHDTGEGVEDESSEQSEDSLDLALLSDPEEGDVAQHQEEPRSSTAYPSGPFRDSSSDEDLSHLFYKEENYEPPAAKRRRLEKDSVGQDDSIPPLIPMTALPFDRDVALPSKECEAEGQMEANTYPINPVRRQTLESVVSASDNSSETDDAVRVFDDVYSMTWKTIEESGNRYHLVAKALGGLSDNRINQLSDFLGSYMPFSYQEFTRDALKHMSDDSPVLEGWDPEESHSVMLMTALFVSWINVIQVPLGAFTVKEVKKALVATRYDLDEDQFSPFFECLNDLLGRYKKWLTLSSRVQHHEKELAQHQWLRRKRTAVALNRAQKDGQQRQADQDEAKRAFRSRVDYEQIPAKPVSFGDNVIHLDPYIGSRIQPHQLHGVQFMFREIVENKGPEGCLLAHTMGLGKTMQVISLLVTISNAGASQDPAIRDQIPQELRQLKTLILCPASLIQNWCREFAMWSPDSHNLGKVRPILAKSSTTGPDRTGEICAWNDEGGVLIISYEMFRNLAGNNAGQNEDPEKQSTNKFVKSWLLESPNLVVADEAQVLRNNTTKIAQTTCRIRTRKRIALSGTPLSNGLKDYYWMVDWIAPGYLGTFADFSETFITPIENGSHIDSTWLDRRMALQRQEMFLRIIDPKVQRADMSVLTNKLPPKYEFSVYFELTSLQKVAYNLVIEGIPLGKTANVSSKLLSWLSPIKLCCNHPTLLKENLETRATKSAPSKQRSPSVDDHGLNAGFDVTTEEVTLPRSTVSELDDLFSKVPNLMDPSLSSRVAILDVIVNQAIAVGDKVLVFSSSIPTLNYLAQLMQRTQRKYYLLHGTVATAERPEIIRKFNKDQSIHVFLVSTKAGGIGLNIHAANRVVIFDFLFNPTCEEQAVGRAHRIGQIKPVFVYRLIAGGTIEEKMYGKTVFKSQLAGRLLDDKHIARMGSKAEDKYLVPWEESTQKGGIDEIASEKDAGMMERLRSECAEFILSIKLCGEELDPEDRLTLAEQKSVEDALELRRSKMSLGS
ncbi:SNF2-related protein [Penicillium concentricum]|uniref:SNF2-related protein n=1 Tax=Penicillium concentricum TaxID=293559 RepID=A0A9W9UZA0_9EURO|nr:SNF2-related protein [Penicillium concentricum]KAJ5360655.1 SNF2-related protein [Penicillium concentricum]